ncbi:hypothetical protein M408DRAFT_258912 [Serendipita vermifera MAFF 305830]|uniref:Uncharacterized protein n=1 Tax=Serendipita vermifera MAFF 305830 TaxID=933852 RepID=A0A0C2XR32_SERVB|nr:hypothetical protein M408DRAFT_258912 [Serendipita vermifera MAFF 305830]
MTFILAFAEAQRSSPRASHFEPNTIVSKSKGSHASLVRLFTHDRANKESSTTSHVLATTRRPLTISSLDESENVKGQR